VRPVDPVRGRFFSPFGSRPFVFRRLASEKPIVRIGPATDAFIDFFRFDPNYIKMAARRLRRPYFTLDDREPTLKELLYRPATIEVTGLGEETTAAAVQASNRLIDAALFAMSYLRGIPYRVVDQWPSDELRARPRVFSTTQRRGGFEFELPLVTYNDELLRFYQLGISTEIPELQYLAFYQILEYFFVQVSDEALYARLRGRLGDPAFRPVPKYLDQVIHDVTNHTKTVDETEMLKLLLDKFLSEDDVITFIQRYETHLEESWYTRRQSRFGVQCEVKLQAGHVFGNVARVVKTVRNALVHSSDRFERVGRHVPFSESSALVRKEVPLIKFLAERVIIASAEPAG
jgi:hypothetical protein